MSKKGFNLGELLTDKDKKKALKLGKLVERR